MMFLMEGNEDERDKSPQGRGMMGDRKQQSWVRCQTSQAALEYRQSATTTTTTTHTTSSGVDVDSRAKPEEARPSWKMSPCLTPMA